MFLFGKSATRSGVSRVILQFDEQRIGRLIWCLIFPIGKNCRDLTCLSPSMEAA
jgi:hypothetical protein